MSLHLGNVPASSTLYIPFATYGKTNGESITLTGLAVTDIEIYKNGSVTQRSSDNGYALLDTDGIDFDGITGIHGFSVDLSDNTDAGFYAAGSFYWVVVSAVTVDSQTVNFVAATFRIVVAEATAGYPTVNAAQISGDSTAADNLETAFDDTAGSVPWVGIADQGTAQSVTSTTIVLRSAAAFANDELNGAIVYIVSATTGAGQSRTITDYVNSTDTATVDTWTTTPTGTIVYKVFAVPPMAASVGTDLADALLKRDMSAVTGEAARSPLNALRFLRNKWSLAAGTLTVTKEDDSTSAWTATMTSDAAAAPIIGSDPA